MWYEEVGTDFGRGLVRIFELSSGTILDVTCSTTSSCILGSICSVRISKYFLVLRNIGARSIRIHALESE